MAPARCPVWRRAGIGLALAGLAPAGVAAPALGQTTALHHRPKPVAASPAANALDDNVTGDAAGLPPSAASGPPKVHVRPPLLPGPVLRSAIHSRYSQPSVIAATTTGQCRAQCAESRTQCDGGQGDLIDCDPAWTRCLSSCAGLNYARDP